MGQSKHAGTARRKRAPVVATIVGLAAAALVGACTEWNQHAEAQRKAAEEQQRGVARDTCARMGFTPATTDFAACVEAEISRLPPPAATPAGTTDPPQAPPQ